MKPGLLVASPQMRDPNFEGAVVLLLTSTPEGALGVVVNRETQTRMGDVIDEMDERSPANANRPVLWGGPVEPGSGFVLWTGEAAEGWAFGPHAVSPSRDRLTELVLERTPFTLILGYAGWGPGQLEGEITGGSWIPLEGDAPDVLTAPVSDRYDAALRLLGVDPGWIWMTPVDE